MSPIARLRLTALALTVGLTAGATHARAEDGSPVPSRIAAVNVQAAQQALPTLLGRAGNALEGLQLNASQDSSNASVSVGQTFSSWNSGSSATSADANTYRWSATLSTPVAKGGSSTSLGTLDGLATSTNLAFSLSRYSLGGRKWGGYFSTRAREICGDAIAAYKAATSKDSPYATKPGGTYVPCPATWVRNLKKTLGDNSKLPQSEIDEYQTMDDADAGSGSRTSYALGLTAKAGYEEHTYYDASSLAKSQTKSWPWSAGVYATILPFSRTVAVTLEAQYQRSFKDNDSKTLCPKTSTAANLTCVSGAIAAPKETIKELLSAELRAKVGDAAIDPFVSYDARSGAYAIDFPVYLLNDGKGLTGGLRGAWSSDKHHTIVSLFVTKAFNLLDHQ